ncbi:MAG: type III-B CRISPR-associated protein Cas10/Cmr2 [Desulfobacteraceae bacterium]
MITNPEPYWNNKLSAYLHDPFDKVFKIQGHESRAAKLLEALGLQQPNEKFWKKADAMASGFERGQVPSYSKDENQNGAVDFLKDPILTHPVSDKKIRIDLPDIYKKMSQDEAVSKISEDLVKLLASKIGRRPGDGGYSDLFKGDPEKFAENRFFYIHLCLRFVLAEENTASLGALWHRLPADSRFPDHSIWQHNALTSALYTCMDLAGNVKGAGMAVFSITPVQDYISNARKLRDFWTGSIILSWLAFEGIKWVCENLGPDHILYPSLIDQPLINEYLDIEKHISGISSMNNIRDIASFPNKFLFLLPFEKSEEITEKIKTHIKNQWVSLCSMCEDLVVKNTPRIKEEEKAHIHDMFERQCHDYFDFSWAASRLLTKDDLTEASKILPEALYKNQEDVVKIFNKIIEGRHYDESGTGQLYSVSHSLVQSSLAASKSVRTSTRGEETGEKCHQCREFEVLHCRKYSNDIKASEYKDNIEEFWHDFKKKWNRESDFKENTNEKLCALCMIKRILYRVFENSDYKDHVLAKTFKNQKSYPSTTEMSLYNYFLNHHIDSDHEKKETAQMLHDSDSDTLQGMETPEIKDRYYAVLLMDGDKMGQLVNGSTINSTWQSILHPVIRQKLESPDFLKVFTENWKAIFDHYPQRLLTPSIHAAISESLGDFSIYGVSSIVKKYKGKLIYAGGDDVCAVLPVNMAVDAAMEIRDYYNSYFNFIESIDDHYNSTPVNEVFTPLPGKMSLCLGKGEKISISAGILICHHKENLTAMIKQSHYLLDSIAKDKAGRNACAVELRKRSGGSRIFVSKWDDDTIDTWNIFRQTGQSISQDISKSVVYRLEQFRTGVEAILAHENYQENLTHFILHQLERSGVQSKTTDINKTAENIARLIVTKDSEKPGFEPESLVVSSFILGGEQQ